MAIDKKLIHFNKNEDFTIKNNTGEIKDASIVFIKDTNKIYTHDKEYQFVGWNKLTVDVPQGYELVYFRDGAVKTADGEYFCVVEE